MLSIEELQSCYAQTFKKRLEIFQLRRILKVFPDSFRFEWQQQTGNTRKYQLMLLSGSTSNLDERRLKIKSLLMDKTSQFHDEFLRVNSLTHEDKSIWHPKFNVHAAPDIEAADFPLRPDIPQVEPLDQFLNTNEVKNNILSDILQRTAVSEQISKEERRRKVLEEVTSLFVLEKSFLCEEY